MHQNRRGFRPVLIPTLLENVSKASLLRHQTHRHRLSYASREKFEHSEWFDHFGNRSGKNSATQCHNQSLNNKTVPDGLIVLHLVFPVPDGD